MSAGERTRRPGQTAGAASTPEPGPRASRPARGRLTLLGWISLVPLVVLWRSMDRAMAERPRPVRRHVVPGPLADGLSVDGPVALWREGEAVTAVSLRCPHLGCRVRPAGDGTLTCPCHGSRFDGRGHVVRGPARADLTPLRVTPEPEPSSPEALVVDLVG